MVPFFKFFFEPKNHFFIPTFLCDHYAVIFNKYYCKINLLFFRFTLHKSRKNFQKWTKKMSKNRYVKTFLGKNARH
jgi:hypothetical protein